MRHVRESLGFARNEYCLIGLPRITFHLHIMRGRACIRGMRVTVSLVLNLVADGMSAAEIVEAYPYLEVEAVGEALRYAAWLVQGRILPIEALPAG